MPPREGFDFSLWNRLASLVPKLHDIGAKLIQPFGQACKL